MITKCGNCGRTTSDGAICIECLGQINRYSRMCTFNLGGYCQNSEQYTNTLPDGTVETFQCKYYGQAVEGGICRKCPYFN